MKEKKEEKKKDTTISDSILCCYLMNSIDSINKDNYQNASLTQYISTVIHSLSAEIIKNKIKNNIVNNINNEIKKIIIFKIPCDIMTFLKINSSHKDIDNIIDISYNITKAEFT